MFCFNNISKDRRHPGHDIRRGEGKGPLQLGGDRRTCNPRDPFCVREDPRRERYRREGLARDDVLFEPRRSTFQGGLNPAGPMGGLAGSGLMGGIGTPFGGSPLFAGSGYADDLADLNVRGPPMGIPISELTAGMSIGGAGGLRGLQHAPAHGYGRLQPQLYDYDSPMMMQQQYANLALPRSPLIDPRLQYFDECALGGYQRENLPNSPMALGLNHRENILLRGRGMPMYMNTPLSPLRSGASSIRSGRSGRGMEVPMMSGGLGGVNFGNYRPPYVEDYESEIDELDRAIREQEWFGQGDYVIVGDDLGGLGGLSGRRL